MGNGQNQYLVVVLCLDFPLRNKYDHLAKKNVQLVNSTLILLAW